MVRRDATNPDVWDSTPGRRTKSKRVSQNLGRFSLWKHAPEVIIKGRSIVLVTLLLCILYGSI